MEHRNTGTQEHRNTGTQEHRNKLVNLLIMLLMMFGLTQTYGQTITWHSAMLAANGDVKTFGRNEDCQLGLGSTSTPYTSPQNTGITNAVAIASGGKHQLALLDDGSVFAWGHNIYGSCGSAPNPPNYRICSPQEVNLPGCAIAISAGGNFSMALLADGTIWAWGRDNVGQLGDAAGANTSYGTPFQVSGISTAIAISAGTEHAMALLADGTVRAWGGGSNGQLGDGTTSNKWTPIQVITTSGNLTNVVKIDAGALHNIALKSDNTVYTWGFSYQGRLGIGSVSTPYFIAYATLSTGFSGGTIIDVAAGYAHSMILQSNGSTKVSGSPNADAFGICSLSGNYLTPISGPTVSGAVDIRIPTGATYGHIVKSNGQLYGWGQNDYGAVGVGSSSSSICPMQLVSSSAKPSSDNHPQPCCVAIREDERLELEGTYSSGSTINYYGQNLAITGPITLTSGNHYLTDCDVVCTSDASITINSGARLYIQSGSHLYACDEMWQGIDVKNGARIYFQSSSIIEDAELAIDLEYGALYTINTATFNRNYQHFSKHMPPSGSPVYTGDYRIVKSKFLCQTTASIGSTPVHQNLLVPHENDITLTQILAVDVPKLLVGSSGNGNTFDNAAWLGISTNGVSRVEVLYNSFTEAGLGATYVVDAPGADGETITINYNTYEKIQFPILCYDNGITVRAHITHNEINFAGMGSPPPIGMRGITVQEILLPSGGNYNHYDISDNLIHNATTGIYLQNLRGNNTAPTATLIVQNDTITQTATPSDQGAGIKLENVVEAAVVGNEIHHPSNGVNWHDHAIRVSNGNTNAVYCNYLHDIGNGLWFDGYQTTDTRVATNTFYHNGSGLLLNWSDIGKQPLNTTFDPHDNEWTDPSWWDNTNSKYTTNVLGTHSHTTEFRVQSSPPSVYYPDENQREVGGMFVGVSVMGGSWQNSCEVFNGPSFKTDGSQQEAASQPSYLNVIQPAVATSEREANQQWIGQYGLYDKLTRDEELSTSSSELETFVAERASSNMGRLHDAITGFSAARNGNADALTSAGFLQQMQPINSVESTLKEVLELLYANATDLAALNDDEVDLMRTIARRCPLDDGFGVYIARAALLKVDIFPRNYVNECELAQPYEDVRNKLSSDSRDKHFFAYPNPNRGEFTVEYKLNQGEDGQIEVFDLSGRVVCSISLQPESSLTQINLKNLRSGLYLLHIRVDGSPKFSERISIIE